LVSGVENYLQDTKFAGHYMENGQDNLKLCIFTLENNNRIPMNKPLLLLCLLASSLSHLTAQTTISLTFTAEENGTWLPLDSVRIENLTRGATPPCLAQIPFWCWIMELVFTTRQPAMVNR